VVRKSRVRELYKKVFGIAKVFRGKLYTFDMSKLRDISRVGGINERRAGEKRPVCTLWRNKSIWSFSPLR